MTSLDLYPYAEVDVAIRLGITMRDLKRIKKTLPPDAHAVVEGQSRFSPGGLEALKKAAGIQQEIDHPEKTSPRAPQAIPLAIPMIVERLCPNPTWVKARAQDMTLNDVRVVNNHNMHRGQPIRAIRQADGRWAMVLREIA